MAEKTAAVPLIVLARSQDAAEAINSTMRNAGHAVNCLWVSEPSRLPETLRDADAHMLIAFVGASVNEMSAVMTVRNQVGSSVPVLFGRDQVDEEGIAAAMQIGARDVVTLNQRLRLQLVIRRELEAYRLMRALNTTQSSAREYREQLKSIVTGSADAIAHVQEGIIIDANPAWLELLGNVHIDAIVGQPMMDIFEADTNPALKSAISACLQGRWTNDIVKAQARTPAGQTVTLEMGFSKIEFDGEPAVRLSVSGKAPPAPSVAAAAPEPIVLIPDEPAPAPGAPETDAATGFLQRQAFVKRIREIVTQPVKAGVRQIVFLEPDELDKIAENVGPLALEDFIGQFGHLLAEQNTPSDVAGRFGNGLMLLMERGTAKDIEQWAASFIKKVSQHVFNAGDKSLTCTCSIGIGLLDPRAPNLDIAMRDALSACLVARDRGTGQFETIDHTEADTRQEAADKIWVKIIKAALMENRFRLMQQPIASLLGDDKGMFDVLVRMINETNEEVLPSEFLPVAERNDLMKNIDRWVIGAAMSFCGSRAVKRLFVRLSKDSVRDKSLTPWLVNQLKASRIEPEKIAFQVSEVVAAEHLSDTAELAGAVRKQGFKFVLEHFGIGRDPRQLLAHLPVDYIKIDGSLMQGLSIDQKLQSHVRELVDQAKAKKVGTIAERVEDANTMAILWQLGVEFIQGYFVNEPEQVTIG